MNKVGQFPCEFAPVFEWTWDLKKVFVSLSLLSFFLYTNTDKSHMLCRDSFNNGLSWRIMQSLRLVTFTRQMFIFVHIQTHNK
jgi:hypothetical protein